MKKFPIVIMLLIFSCSYVHAELFKHPGMEVSFSVASDLAPGANDPNYDFYCGKFSLFNDFIINKNWIASLYGDIGILEWVSNDHQRQSSVLFGSELIFYRKIFKKLSLGLGGGFATLSEKDDLPDLGDSGFYGTISGRVKYEINKDYGLMFAVDHISDVLEKGNDGDGGKNTIGIKIYYSF